MNLARHAAILWRFRAVTATGLAIGLFLAILASYTVSLSGGPKLVSRGTSTYTSTSQILVTQRGCPNCRVVLPVAPATTGTTTTTGEQPSTSSNDSVQAFADPGRFMLLADIYTQYITSDEVLRRIPQHPSAAQITATPLPANSGTILPIISLSTIGPSSKGAYQLNLDTIKALRSLINDEGTQNKVKQDERVELQMLKSPSPGALLAGPSHTASILALLLCIIGTIAVTHLLASLRDRPRPSEDDYDLEELGLWPADEAGNVHAPEPAGAAANGNGSFAGEHWAPPSRRSE
jgi:hypothetical protein